MENPNFHVLFPDERERGVSRLRQCQLVMTRMLKILDFLCRKYQIQYFLIEGTLRGAIIYQGFLPWDDDLDIGMTRDNYEKFVHYVVPELPEDIFFQNDESDPYYPSCHVVEAKLRDKYSSYKREKNNKKIGTFHDGLQIDISVYDRSYLPFNLFIYTLNRALIFFFKKKNDKKRAHLLKWISKYSPVQLVYGSSFICNLKRMKLRSNYIKPEELKSFVTATFEDVKVFIPIGWESYLKRQYGDYMQLPLLEKHKRHHGTDIPDPFTPCNHSEILYWDSASVNRGKK